MDKKEVLSSFARKANLPVFVTWTCWDSIERDEERTIERADPKAFYVKELPDNGQTDFTPQQFQGFLKSVRGLEKSRDYPFSSL